jgi:hypothetical protein
MFYHKSIFFENIFPYKTVLLTFKKLTLENSLPTFLYRHQIFSDCLVFLFYFYISIYPKKQARERKKEEKEREREKKKEEGKKEEEK